MTNGWRRPPAGEQIFMERKMYLWRGACIFEGEDVFKKGQMYLWNQNVFMKEKYIYEGEDLFRKGEKQNPGILKKLKIRCFSKNKVVPGISHRRNK